MLSPKSGVLSITTGVVSDWMQACPLEYRSGNAPGKRDVLGTLVLAILAGHRRYAHVTGLRGDSVAAQAVGMARIVAKTRRDTRCHRSMSRPARRGCTRR